MPPIALIIFSNDLDNYLSNIERERKIIEEALELYNDTNRLRIITRSSVSIQELFRLFNRYKGRICLFHFAGHASGNGLQLNDENFNTEIGQANGLAALIKREVEQGQLQIVFLNGCSTLAQVNGLQNAGVPNIIATNCPINDSKAVLLAKQLYRTLANTDNPNPFDSPTSIQQAFDTAIAYLNTIDDFEIEEANRGLKLRRPKKEYDSPWVLFAEDKKWRLPNQPIYSQLQTSQRINKSKWTTSLVQALRKQNVAVRPKVAFEHYGWLISAFLQKMETKVGQASTLRRLSFMVEAFQSSLRYLSAIQMAQLLRLENPTNNLTIRSYLQLSPKDEINFDYLDLLLVTTDLLEKEKAFVPEIHDLLDLFYDEKKDFQQTVYFLQEYRLRLLKGTVSTENLEQLLEEYLTALVIWLRRIAFLAQYRLVSIKDIQLNYRLGTAKQFVHLYGELHGMYRAMDFGQDDDYTAIAVENEFTYNQSVLLFKGKNMETALERIHDISTYLSLSPLVIDQSVFSEKPTQTPEIYYYTGQTKGNYTFAQHKNELNYEHKERIVSNKTMLVEEQNNDQPKLDELFEQIELLFGQFTILD